MSGETVETYHSSKLPKLNITQHKQCFLPLFPSSFLLPPSTSNLSSTQYIKESTQYWNSIFLVKDQNYSTTQNFELWCQVISSFDDLQDDMFRSFHPAQYEISNHSLC